jgi:hypothetical protein
MNEGGSEMMDYGLLLAALLAPPVVWALILTSMARTVNGSMKSGLPGWKFAEAEIDRVSPLSPEQQLDRLEEEHAQSRLVNARYEEEFNYHRAA